MLQYSNSIYYTCLIDHNWRNSLITLHFFLKKKFLSYLFNDYIYQFIYLIWYNYWKSLQDVDKYFAKNERKSSKKKYNVLPHLFGENDDSDRDPLL